MTKQQTKALLMIRAKFIAEVAQETLQKLSHAFNVKATAIRGQEMLFAVTFGQKRLVTSKPYLIGSDVTQLLKAEQDEDSVIDSWALAVVKDALEAYRDELKSKVEDMKTVADDLEEIYG